MIRTGSNLVQICRISEIDSSFINVLGFLKCRESDVALSSSGLGRVVLSHQTGVRFPVALPFFCSE